MIALIGSIIIGIYAQKEKGRTGFFWALACLITDILLFVLFVSPMQLNSPSPNEDLAKRLTSTIVTVLLFGIIILTLPNKATKS